MSSNALAQQLLELAGFNRWRRAGGPPIFLLVWCTLVSTFMGVFLWAAASTAGGVFSAVPQLRERPLRTLADRQAGPVALHGKLAGPERTAPLGDPAVGWYAWLDRVVTSGKSTTRERVCTVWQLDGLSLEDGGHTIAIDVPADRIDVAEANSFSAPGVGRFIVLAEEREASPPAALLQRPECTAPQDATLEYHQLAWRRGLDVVVSGCRTGDRVEPCGDRADFLVSDCRAAGGVGAAAAGGTCGDARRGVDAMLQRWSGGVEWVTAFVLLMVGAFVTALGSVTLWQHRKLQRRRRALARVV